MVHNVKVLRMGLIATAFSIPLMLTADGAQLAGALPLKADTSVVIPQPPNGWYKTGGDRPLMLLPTPVAYRGPARSTLAMRIPLSYHKRNVDHTRLSGLGLGGVRTTGEGGY